MARVADHAGYMSNYFRWFGSPEDPFGWYYNLLALMTHVSDASIWIRLPDLICALVCWLLLSREVLPRLGPAVSGSRAAMWAAGLVLLAAWMPFNNGLRPEGQIATGALITYVLIERAIGSGRLTPFALAITTAAFTLGIQPTGLIAVAALVAGGRPILRILVRRREEVGTWPLVAPLLAAGTVVLTVVFADQTLATVLEATRIRTAIGPSQEWFTEILRYYYLILPTTDAAISRRVAFLFTVMCLFPSLFMMLRRKRIPGVARGPAWRLMGVIFATIFFLMFTPTKWIHHFGLFAAVGGAMAALATVMVSPAGAALGPQPDDVPVAGVLRAGAVLRIDQRVVVRLQLRCAVQQLGAPAGRRDGQRGLLRAVRDRGTVGVLAARLRPAGVPDRRQAHRGTDTDRRRVHGRGVRGVDDRRRGAPVPDLLQRLGQRARVRRRLRHGRRRARRTRLERRLPAGPAPADQGPLGPLGGSRPVGFSPNGVPDRIIAEAIRINNPQPGTDADWNRPVKLSRPGRQRVDRAAALRP